MQGLSKSRITACRQCPKQLWLRVNKPHKAMDSAAARLAIRRGNEIGAKARELYPGGVFVETLNAPDAIRQTQESLRDAPNRPIYEAAFARDGVLVRVDVLLPDPSGSRLIEVKGSSSLKDYHATDLAVQTWVLRQAGHPVRSAVLAHADRDFVYRGDGNYARLLIENDLTADVGRLALDVPGWLAEARAVLAGDEPPLEMGSRCKEPFECSFRSYCARQIVGAPAFPLSQLYRASPRLKENLSAAGYHDIREIPESSLKSALHRRIRAAAISGVAYLDDESGKAIRQLPYPRYFLDFETIGVGLPRWADTYPGLAVPFQWSCHVQHVADRLEHHEFLAEGNADPRRSFAESLVEACGTHGPVFVYHAPFESGRLRELADHLPDLADRLQSIRDRLVDLEPLTRDSYYHPCMKGSWSIKSVLPTIAPDLDYDNLDVQDGNLAQEAYLRMTDSSTSPEDREAIRRQLLAYCERDTEAMVRLAHFLGRGDGGQ